MVHLTRRRFLVGAGAAAAALSLSGYATAYETGEALTLTKYAPRLRNWPDDLELKIAVIADIHACYPWMSEERVGRIVDLANAQKPDLTVLLGDYVCTHRFVSGYVPPGAWAEQLARLEAPLGVYSILGNHDWWSAAIPTEPADNSAQRPPGARAARRSAARKPGGAPVPARAAVLADRSWRPAGARAEPAPRPWRRRSPAAMRAINDDAPAILLVHEPFFFPWVPDRIALTLAGHMHGGRSICRSSARRCIFSSAARGNTSTGNTRWARSG